MTRPVTRFFVNRENIINEVRDLLLSGRNVLIIGLRGYGKTALATEILRRMELEGIKTLFINCLRVLEPRNLFDEAVRDWSFLGRKDELKFPIVLDAREVIDKFFETIINAGVKVVTFDEFTALLERFGSFKPFNETGGPLAVAGYIKDYIESNEIAVLASDTSIEAIRSIVLSYSSPLLKSFHRVFFIEPLSASDGAILLRYIMEERRKKISESVSLKISQMLYGVPQYIIFIGNALPNNPSEEDAEDVLLHEMTRGILNIYFELLLEKLSYEEKAILYAIARGSRTFSSISKQFVSINTVRALRKLIRSGILIKSKKGRKKVEYHIYDKVFESWLKLNEQPELKKETAKRLLLSTLSFESYIREALSMLTTPIEIIDANGLRVTIPVMKRVERLVKGDVEIDVFGVIGNSDALVAECYFGDKAGIEKARELEKGVELVKKLGYNPKLKLIFSYFGFSKELKDYAKKRKIYLLQAEQIRIITKNAGLPVI